MRKTNIRLLSNEEALKSQKRWYRELLNWIKSEEMSVLTKIVELDGGKNVITPLKHSELWSSLYHLEIKHFQLYVQFHISIQLMG